MENNENKDLNEEKKIHEQEENKKQQEEIKKDKDKEKESENSVEEFDELKERKQEMQDKIKYGMRKKFKKKTKDEKETNKEGEKSQKQTKNKFSFKSIILLLFVVVMVMSIPSLMSDAKTKDQKVISYSNFLEKASKGEFKIVQEKEGYVIGKKSQTDETVFRARMITDRVSDDSRLMTALTTTSVEIKSEDPEKTPLIVQILISWFPMLLLVGIWFFMMNKMKGGGNGGSNVFNMGKSKAKDNGENVSTTKFTDVAGIEEAKQELIEVVDFLKEPEKYKKIGATIPKGVLLLGAPGTGKTLLARAVAGEAAVPFFSISGSEFVEMFVGVGASRVRDLFAKARKAAPCIVFIDEIDAVGRKRGSGQGGGNDEREQTLNQLLVEMDGFSTEETIIVIAATNRAEILDKALMRPGRFDRQVVVDKPDIKGREAILRVHVKGKKLGSDVDLHILAKKTPGFVGADLANLLNEAAILAARQKRDLILMEDLEEASEKVSIGPARKSRVTVEKEKHIVAYHEVGHAMIQTFYKDIVDPVHKVTIIPRGMAALGYTMSLPTEDRYLRSRKEYLADIRGLLGGRAAEEVFFGDITTGASNDIERATGIAHAMVTKLGMSDRFGPILLDATKDGDMFPNKIYGEETAKAIDDEIRKMINDAYEEVKTTLRDNYDLLDKISKTLLERETITGIELNILMDGGELEPLKPVDTASNDGGEDTKAKGFEELKEELVSEGKIITEEVAEKVEENNVEVDESVKEEN